MLLSGCFPELLKHSPLSEPLSSKKKKRKKHLPVLLPPPSSLQASSAAQNGKIIKRSSLKIESTSSASNHSDSLSWGVTRREALDSMFKNNLQLLQEAISGSIWGHPTPHPDTLKLLNDAEWLQSSSVYTLHPPSSAQTVTSRADKELGLPGRSLTRSRIRVFDGEIIPLWCEQSQRHPGERKPIIPQQRLTLDNHMLPPRFSGDSAGIGTMFEKLTQKEGNMFKRDSTKEPHES